MPVATALAQQCIRLITDLAAHTGTNPTATWPTSVRSRASWGVDVVWRSRALARGLGVVGEAAGLAGVDRDGRAHGGGHGDLPQVAALGRRRLQSQDLVDGRGVVLHQGRVGEGRLADDEVEVRVPVHPELDLAALDVGD